MGSSEREREGERSPQETDRRDRAGGGRQACCVRQGRPALLVLTSKLVSLALFYSPPSTVPRGSLGAQSVRGLTKGHFTHETASP